jgi:hypothetical protein
MQLTDRDKAILEVFRQHRAAPRNLLLPLFGGSESSLQKWLKRLSEFVTSESPYSGFTYYRLTPGGARFLGAPEEVARPLGVQALQKTLGVAFFCFATEPARWRYTRSDFAVDFPELVSELDAEGLYYLDYYIDRADEVRLGEIVVDHGGDYQKLLQKLNGRLRRHIRTSRALREIIEAGLFCFAVVVPNDDKRRAIEGGIARKPLKAYVRVHTCSELGDLLAGR